MRSFRLIIIAILTSFFVINAVFLRRSIAVLLCGVLSFNSTACYGWLTDSSSANATVAPKSTYSAESILSPRGNITAIPRIRKPSLELPLDFRIVRQVPFSSGKREILFTSPSSGVEQVYSTSLPDAERFELFGIEFRNLSGQDLSPLLAGKDIKIDPAELASSLNNFKISFKDNTISKVVLADGTTADFSLSQVTIKSGKGNTIEKIPLSSLTTAIDSDLISQANISTQYLASNHLELNPDHRIGERLSDGLIAQAGSADCQNGTSSSLKSSSQQMTQIGNQLTTGSSKSSTLVGSALNAGGSALNGGNVGSQIPATVCKPPIRCNEQVISGGSEIRTDLFQVPQGSDRKVSLEYEFFQIPDKLEMDFDGKDVISIGPTSGSSRKTFSFPNDAKYVGVKITGNQDIKSTEWWYGVSCSHPCNDTRIAKNYNAQNPQYHYYRNNSLVTICSTKTPGCTKEAVFNTMISQVRFLAPTDSEEKAMSCKEEVLIPGFGFKGYYPEFYNNTIKAEINPEKLLATNYTLPGHMFYPGEIRRRVVEINGLIQIETIGEGVGGNRGINLLFGTQGLWDLIDETLKEKVQENLSNLKIPK